MITKLGSVFPDAWLWSKYENRIINLLIDQISYQFTDKRNLFINLTWFGPQFNNESWKEFLDLYPETFDNVFLLSTVDPPMINPEQISNMVKRLGNPCLYKIGNFDTKYHFNFFAPILKEHFAHYSRDDLLLKELQYLYVSYNRKPREHRVNFVQKLLNEKLDKVGIITLGKPDIIYDKDPNNDLYFTIGEKIEDYIQHGHWYNTDENDQFGIPHDVLSLHNFGIWQKHFLHIIGATEFNTWDDIFISETQFKPIIGMRPFLINGNVRTYKWLRNNGFCTFEKWFPKINFDDSEQVHENIIKAIHYLVSLTQKDILDMYNDMIPTLQHNRDRFYEFADEQSLLIENILNDEYKLRCGIDIFEYNY